MKDFRLIKYLGKLKKKRFTRNSLERLDIMYGMFDEWKYDIYSIKYYKV